jgi:hypothetical protein
MTIGLLLSIIFILQDINVDNFNGDYIPALFYALKQWGNWIPIVVEFSIYGIIAIIAIILYISAYRKG